ncbi:MAG: adenine deaminase [Sediminibacterium sp.]|nr:adenine deaminase [Sediminibacterium sp.]
MLQTLHTLTANLVDVVNNRIYPANIQIAQGRILSITETSAVPATYILPGFIDAHVHVESSMLTPREFARVAVKHGTVATISDPHEIANVLGVKGVEFMLANAAPVPFHFFFGAPSCVPATAFETAGARIDADDIRFLLQKEEIVYLAEMMNFPGVIHNDQEVMEKLAIARQLNKPVDGHAPGLRGKAMQTYFNAGISTDHECFRYDEALEKLQHGVKIMIREGSAAKNFNELIPLLGQFPEQILFCCDDKHPDNLLEGHINEHVKRAVAMGFPLMDVLRAASLNVIEHYRLPVGVLQVGDSADFIEVDNLTAFTILKTVIKGEVVASDGVSHIPYQSCDLPNYFQCSPKHPEAFKLKRLSDQVRVIEMHDGQLVTGCVITETPGSGMYSEADPERDIIKLAVVNRYADAPPAIGFIKNTGLKRGAIASCVAHDCHNIVVAGVSDEAICKAVNAIIAHKGGIALACDNEVAVLPLPIAGIMSPQPAEEVAARYLQLDQRAKELGCTLKAPYMSLSFMALLVIPELKMSDKGLFDGHAFRFTDVFVEQDKC